MLYTGIESSEIAILTRVEELGTHKLRSLMEGELKGERMAREMLAPQIAELLADTQRLNADIERMNAQADVLNSQLDATRADLTRKETTLSVSLLAETAQLKRISDLTREGERLRCVLCVVLCCVALYGAVVCCTLLCMGERIFVLALTCTCLYVSVMMCMVTLA